MSMGSEAYVDSLCDAMDREYDMKNRLSRGVWVTKDGKAIPITEMETSHIKNTIKWMEKNDFEYEDEYKRLLTQELNRREGGEGI